MFSDRIEAGARLAEALHTLAGRDAVVIALPRGGVPVAAEVARRLHLPLDIRLAHKIGTPGNEELALGAVTEEGTTLLNKSLIASLGLHPNQVSSLCNHELERVRRRSVKLRPHVVRQPLAGKIVVLVDDGLATGATMQAAISSARHEQAASIVVAVPVAPSSALYEMGKLADQVICLETPRDFFGVGQFYYDFSQLTDEDVTDILDRVNAEAYEREVI